MKGIVLGCLLPARPAPSEDAAEAGNDTAQRARPRLRYEHALGAHPRGHHVFAHEKLEVEARDAERDPVPPEERVDSAGHGRRRGWRRRRGVRDNLRRRRCEEGEVEEDLAALGAVKGERNPFCKIL
jgi:hypothetical protein